jgi:hypothetical protein
MPNSAAEMDAYGKAMEGYAKELASYSEAIAESHGRSRIRGGNKRRHQSGNFGGNNGNYDSNPGNPAVSAQHRERARRSPISQLPNLTSATLNGPASLISVSQTPQNLVLHTTPKPQTIDEFFTKFVSLDHLAQLDMIKRLDREQRDRRTSDSRCVEIALILRRIEVVDPVVEAPMAKRPAPGKNGKPTVEVLTMHATKNKQLPLTQEDFGSIMAEATAFIEKLPKGGTYPEWNWASWCYKYRGQIAVASEGQAVLVTALINSLEVPGVDAFHLWRESEIMELTPVKLILDYGFMQSWTDEMVMDGIFTRNPSLEGTPHEVKSVIDTQTKRHIVHFLADPKLKTSLAKLQNGSSTFYLRLGGQDRKTIMARDPLVVAAEEAAELKSRIERALAKAIEASNPDLVVPAATPDHQQQQQPGNNTIGYTTNKSNPNPNPDTSHNPGTGPSETPRETEFIRVWKLMEVERVQLESEQKHQQEQLKRLQHHQQQQVAQFDNERLLLQRGSTTGSTTPIQQLLQQQQGTANSFSIIKYLTYNRDTSPQGVVKGRVASFEAPSAVSPPPRG